jgi:hypothetical protein
VKNAVNIIMKYISLSIASYVVQFFNTLQLVTQVRLTTAQCRRIILRGYSVISYAEYELGSADGASGEFSAGTGAGKHQAT